MKQWLYLWAYTILVILGSSSLYAGWIYDVDGIMVPTVASPVSASFGGTLEFLGDTMETGVLRINLTNEFDPVTGEQFWREFPFRMTTNASFPLGVRSFSNLDDSDPFLMQWLDLDGQSELDFGAMNLDGSGWDAMSVSFPDYQLGTITSLSSGRETPAVSEPTGFAICWLAGLGFIALGLRR